MSVQFAVLPAQGLCYVRYTGVMTISMARAAYEAYVAHTDFNAAQHHLVDFSQVTHFDADVTEVMQFMALMTSNIPKTRAQCMFVYYATTDEGRQMCQRAAASWSDVPQIVVRVADREQDAMDILGLRQRNIQSLLAETPLISPQMPAEQPLR